MIRLAIRVARADAEIALAELLELAPAGVEEVDHGDTIEYAVYGAEGELPTLPAVRAAAGAALVAVTTTRVADDWASRWRDFHVPVTIGERLHVRPPWCDPPAGAGAALLDIVIDPNQAFGTGAHATTRLCLEALLALPSPPRPARRSRLRLGRAGDRRRQARLGSRQRPGPRGGGGRGRARERAGQRRDARRPRTATCCTTMRPRRARRPSWRTCCARCWPTSRGPASPASRPQTMIVSGLLRAEADAIAAAFAREQGLREQARGELGEWAALTLVA